MGPLLFFEINSYKFGPIKLALYPKHVISPRPTSSVVKQIFEFDHLTSLAQPVKNHEYVWVGVVNLIHMLLRVWGVENGPTTEAYFVDVDVLNINFFHWRFNVFKV